MTETETAAFACEHCGRDCKTAARQRRHESTCAPNQPEEKTVTAKKAAPPKRAAARRESPPRAKGPTKGEQIVAYYAKHPGASRGDVAKAVGCVEGRVGEVLRAGLVPEPQQPKRTPHKGDAIAADLKAHPGTTRREIAERVGCTVSRVTEIFGTLGDSVVKGDGATYAMKAVKAKASKKAGTDRDEGGRR